MWKKWHKGGFFTTYISYGEFKNLMGPLVVMIVMVMLFTIAIEYASNYHQLLDRLFDFSMCLLNKRKT